MASKSSCVSVVYGQGPRANLGFTLTLSVFLLWVTVTSTETANNSSNVTTRETSSGTPPPIFEAVFRFNYTHVNVSPPPSDPADLTNSTQTAEISDGGAKFDDHAVQRGLVVFGGLVLIIMVYLSIKFLWLRRKRRLRNGGNGELGVGAYGPLQTSEMNLLEPLDHDGSDSDDDETTHYSQLPTSLRSEFEPRRNS